MEDIIADPQIPEYTLNYIIMKKLLLTAALILVAHLGMAQDAVKKDALKYLELSGQIKSFEFVLADIVKNVPAEKQAEFKKELDVEIKKLMDKMADLYVAEFTPEDLKAAIAFYESPAGKRISAKTGVLAEKGQVIGQEWGMGLQPLLMKYMQE